jgi:uncharacterized protein YecE (DUF72 family)
MGQVRIGISGWQYDSWRGDFYPAGLARARELEYAASLMPTVELNASFYSLQRPTSYRRWYDQTPDGFVFAVKGGRYVTHFKRLVDVEAALANYFGSGVLLLADKLGPVLWQLPERAEFDPGVLAGFLDLLPTSTAEMAWLAARHDDKLDPERAHLDVVVPAPVRHALEVRHSSFVDDRFFALLEQHDIACVLADSAGRWPVLDQRTASFEYVRLHGHTGLYTSRYAGQTLDRWADRCRRWAAAGRDVYVYFDNDAHGHAPHDALRLIERLNLVDAGTGGP